MNDRLIPEAKTMREALWTLAEDARRYRELKARYIGVDFTQPNPTGQGMRCVLNFAWPESRSVSKDLDSTVDELEAL